MSQKSEVDQNFEAFKAILPEILDAHRGKFALMRDQKILDYFDTARDAFLAARGQSADNRFSIQEVTDEQLDLGYFSHALPR